MFAVISVNWVDMRVESTHTTFESAREQCAQRTHETHGGPVWVVSADTATSLDGKSVEGGIEFEALGVTGKPFIARWG